MHSINYNSLSQRIIGCAIEVHRELGPGLLESTYQECLKMVLYESGLSVVKAYKIDLLVENCIVLELKAVDIVLEVHKAQLLTYMKLGNYKLGLLLNFNVRVMTDGIYRRVLGF
jgi:hypothetical protein